MSDEDWEQAPRSTEGLGEVVEVATWGRTSVADGDTIAHGLGVVPDQIFVNGTAYRRLYITVQTVTTTTFTVGISRRKWGGATGLSNGSTVNHGVGETPDAVIAVSRDASIHAAVTAIGATNFTLGFYDLTTSPPVVYGAGAAKIYWEALVNSSNSYNVDWMAISYT